MIEIQNSDMFKHVNTCELSLQGGVIQTYGNKTTAWVVETNYVVVQIQIYSNYIHTSIFLNQCTHYNQFVCHQ